MMFKPGLSYFFRAWKRVAGWKVRKYEFSDRDVALIRSATMVLPDLENPFGKVMAGHDQEKILASADRILEGSYYYFDTCPVYASFDKRWFRDYKHGYVWDYKQCFDIRPKGVSCDVKVPWEISRLHQLVTLGVAYRITNNSSYVRQLKRELLDFIRSNPPESFLNWVYSMEVGIRLFNIVFSMAIVGEEGLGLTPEELGEVKVFVGGSVFFIFRNLEWRGGVRNNHYCISLLGLFLGACLFPNVRVFNGVMSFAVKEIHKEAAFNFLDDGAGVEGSSSYHRLNVEMFLIFDSMHSLIPLKKYAVADAFYLSFKFPRVQPDLLFRLPVDSDRTLFECRLLRAVRFLEIISNSEGEYPLIGDNDSGRIIKIHPAVLSDGRETWSSAAYLEGFVSALREKNEYRQYESGGLLPVRCNGCCQEYYLSNWNVVVLRSKVSLAVVQLGMYDLRVKGHAHTRVARVDFFNEGAWVLRSGGTYSYNLDRSAYYDSKRKSNILIEGGIVSALRFRDGFGESDGAAFYAADILLFEFLVSGCDVKIRYCQGFDECDFSYFGDYLSSQLKVPVINFRL